VRSVFQIQILTNDDRSGYGCERLQILRILRIRAHNTVQKALFQMALLAKSPIRKDEESADVKLKMEKQVRK
jgi:hypothetical protein